MLKFSEVFLHNHRTRTAAVLMVLALFTGTGCSEPDNSEAALREVIGAMASAAEQKKIKALFQYVSPDYLDSESRSYDDVRRIVQLHFLQNRKIHIYKHITRIDISENIADVIVLAAAAGQPVDSPQSLLNIEAEFIRFELRFGFDEIWKLTSAGWERGSVNDFF